MAWVVSLKSFLSIWWNPEDAQKNGSICDIFIAYGEYKIGHLKFNCALKLEIYYYHHIDQSSYQKFISAFQGYVKNHLENQICYATEQT